MIKSDLWRHKHYALIGLGKSGHATAEAMKKSAAELYLWDDKLSVEEQQEYEQYGRVADPDHMPWNTIEAVIMSPGVPLTHPTPHPVVEYAHNHELPILGDIELLYQACPKASYISVTGTNGKSTTTALIHHIFKTAEKRVQMGGNIGEPVLSLKPITVSGTYVLELSSYQLDLVDTFRPNIAVWLNISEDHLDRHGDMAGYIAAKKRMFANQTEDDIAIIGIDDEYSEAIYHELISARKQRVIPISVDTMVGNGIDIRNNVLNNNLEKDSLPLIPLQDLKTLQGKHNHQNVAAAYAACYASGIPHQVIVDALHSFPGLAHRMQYLGAYQSIHFVNDSKATNADAAAKALESFDNIFWIAGGVAKEGGIAPLEPYFSKLRNTYLIGEATEAFAKTLEGKAPYVKANTLKAACSQALTDAHAFMVDSSQSCVVLLSPACASFDQFANFEMRGDAFISYVEHYISTNKTESGAKHVYR